MAITIWNKIGLPGPNITHVPMITNWIQPPPGKFKLNTDASFDSSNNIMGLGWILRDDDGRILAAKNTRVMGSYTVEEAEAVSVRETLSCSRTQA